MLSQSFDGKIHQIQKAFMRADPIPQGARNVRIDFMSQSFVDVLFDGVRLAFRETWKCHNRIQNAYLDFFRSTQWWLLSDSKVTAHLMTAPNFAAAILEEMVKDGRWWELYHAPKQCVGCHRCPLDSERVVWQSVWNSQGEMKGCCTGCWKNYSGQDGITERIAQPGAGAQDQASKGHVAAKSSSLGDAHRPESGNGGKAETGGEESDDGDSVHIKTESG